MDGYMPHLYTDTDRKLKQFQPLPLPEPSGGQEKVLSGGGRRSKKKNTPRNTTQPTKSMPLPQGGDRSYHAIDGNNHRRRKTRKAVSSIETSSSSSASFYQGISQSDRFNGYHGGNMHESYTRPHIRSVSDLTGKGGPRQNPYYTEAAGQGYDHDDADRFMGYGDEDRVSRHFLPSAPGLPSTSLDGRKATERIKTSFRGRGGRGIQEATDGGAFSSAEEGENKFLKRRGAAPSATSHTSRGSYKCSRCGLPKMGHVCQPPQMKSGSAQVEIGVTTGETLPESSLSFVTVSGGWVGVPDSDLDEDDHAEEAPGGIDPRAVTDIESSRKIDSTDPEATAAVEGRNSPLRDHESFLSFHHRKHGHNDEDDRFLKVGEVSELPSPGSGDGKEAVSSLSEHDHGHGSGAIEGSGNVFSGKHDFFIDERFSGQNISVRPDAAQTIFGAEFSDFDSDSPRSLSTPRSSQQDHGLDGRKPSPSEPETDAILMGYEMPDEVYIN